MLRAAIKHGICKALSTRAGFEVWDFEIKEEQPSPERVTIEIRYRYQPGLWFSAAITAKSEEGRVPLHEIAAESVPGEVGEKDLLLLAGRHELYAAIERWTTRIEEELSARPSNRVLSAQQKAIEYLEKRLLDIPDQRLTRESILVYRDRLDRLEAAVIELRAPRVDGANNARAEAVHQEFACLRTRLEVLGERSFLHAVLVRLVKHFWDDENLRIIEAGSRAAQDFLKNQALAAGRSEGPRVAATAGPESPVAARVAAEPPARTTAPQPPPASRAPAPPVAKAAAAVPAASAPAPAKPAPAKPAAAKPAAAKPVPAKPVPTKPAATKAVAAKQVAAKPAVAATAPAAKAPPAQPVVARPASGTRATYKPLRPGNRS